MGTINSAFSIISGALDADQSALNIVSGNVANANTPGYTEQRPTWQENSPIVINGTIYGDGVTQTGAQSIRDRVLNERIDQQQQLASASSTRLNALNSLQALFTPDSGSSTSQAGDLSSDITNFFNSFSALEANPSDNSLRQQVLSKASILAGDMSNAANAINGQQAALDQDASGVASQVNALTSSIAKLNLQIQSMSPNGDAGVLEDQRQQDLTQLSKLVGINQITTDHNGLSITTMSGQTLVAGGDSFAMSTGTVNGVTHFFVSGSDITSGLTSGGGELGGYLTARDVDLPNAINALDQLAYGISTEVNAQNAAGLNLSGTAGTNIFFQSTQVAGSALTMQVVMTDPNGIAAAGAGQGTGDNSNAVAMANLLNQKNPPILDGYTLPGTATTLPATGATLLNNQSPTDFFSGFVTSLGSTVSQVQTENTAQSASLSQLQTQSNALSGVNLNDEAAALTTLERAYQAASQVFAILNNVMGSALNLGTQTAVS